MWKPEQETERGGKEQTSPEQAEHTEEKQGQGFGSTLSNLGSKAKSVTGGFAESVLGSFHGKMPKFGKKVKSFPGGDDESNASLSPIDIDLASAALSSLKIHPCFHEIRSNSSESVKIS